MTINAKLNIHTISFDSEPVQSPRVLVPQVRYQSGTFVEYRNRYQIKNDKDVLPEVRRILKTAESSRANLVLLPELSVPRSLVSEIVEWSSNKNCIVVAGSHYVFRDDSNRAYSVCPIVFEGKVYEQIKHTVSPLEKSILGNAGVCPGDKFPVFENTPIGRYANFICSDYLDTSLRTRVLESEIDVASIIAFQSNSNKYHSRINNDVQDSGSGLYVVYSNMRLDDNKMADGKSAFFAVYDRELYQRDLSDFQNSDPNNQNMVCVMNDQSGFVCVVDLDHKKPTLSRTIETEPNITLTVLDQSLDKGNDGSVSEANQVQICSDEAVISSNYKFPRMIFNAIHTSMRSMQSLIRSRIDEEVSVDAHTLADEFSVLLSQSIYYSRGHLALFRSSIDVTNLQISELFSLLSSHTVVAGANDNCTQKVPLQFTSTDELRQILAETWVSQVPDLETLDSFATNTEVYNSITDTFVSSFGGLVSSTLVVDVFSSSAVIYPPPGLAIDCVSVLERAGFIHSFGNLIYIRNVKKTSVSEFEGRLTKYLSSEDISSEGVIPFCFYCHEIFDDYQQEHEERDISNGIVNLKFHSEKFFFGGVPVYAFRDKLKRIDIISKRVKFVGSGSSYHDQIAEIENRENGTIWFFKETRESSLGENFFICYHQTLVNCDPFLKAEEDKPAWLGPVTLPQSLASSMLSLVSQHFDIDSDPCIVDPFLGCGTTLFESYKMYPNARFFGGDINDSCEISVFDNARVLTKSSKELTRITNRISDLVLDENGRFSLCYFNSIYKEAISGRSLVFEPADVKMDWAHTIFNTIAMFVGDKMRITNGTEESSHSAVRALIDLNMRELLDKLGAAKKEKLSERLLVYCYWKAMLRNAHAFIEKREKVSDAVFAEICSLVKFIRELSEGVRTVYRNHGRAGQLLFSSGVSPDFGDLEEYICSERVMICEGAKNGDVRTFLRHLPKEMKEKGADIIITDPPYGFNSDYNKISSLVEIYDKFIELVVELVKNETHLLICLPEQSHNGQLLPSFVTKGWIVPRLMQHAKSQNVSAIQYSRIWPGSYGSIKPPYYWKSKKALTRSILHVILKKDT